MYIANHYVRIGGKVYIKGERIPDGLPEEKISWLLNVDAIHEEKEKVQEAVSEPPFMNPPEHQEETAEEDPKEETAEADEEAEAPEIDVMAGIVQDKPEEKKKTTGRKTSERRKTK